MTELDTRRWHTTLLVVHHKVQGFAGDWALYGETETWHAIAPDRYGVQVGDTVEVIRCGGVAWFLRIVIKGEVHADERE